MENEVKMLLSTNLYEDIKRIAESDISFSALKNKTVLITSAGELLGFYLVCAVLINNDLYDTNTKVVAVDSDDSLFKKYGKLTHRNDIDFIVSKDFSNLTASADFVIHTKIPDREIEIRNIIQFIRDNNAVSVISSDCSVYGDVFNGKDSISESDMGYCDCNAPESHSVQLMRMFEDSAKVAAKNYNLDIKFTRMSQVFGCREYGNNSGYIRIFNDVANHKDIEIERKDGELRGYIYVTDAAAALFKVLFDGEPSEVYNISAGYVASDHIIAKYCVKLFDKLELKIVYKQKAGRLSPMEPTIYNLENAKLKAIGFTPEVELQDGIVRALKIIYENKK